MEQQQASFITSTPNDDFNRNDFVAQGCQLEGHDQQEIRHIFINKDNGQFVSDRLGCAECVSRRSDHRTLSLSSAFKVQKNKQLYNFPVLDPTVQQNVEAAINLNASLTYDKEINDRFDQLIQNLEEIFDEKERKGIALANEIKDKGDEMKEEFRNITNCDRIRDCASNSNLSFDQLNTEFNQIIASLYENQKKNDDSIKQRTDIYEKKNKTFKLDFAERIRNSILAGIDKISFKKQEDKSSPEIQSNPLPLIKVPARQRSGYTLLEKFEFNQVEPTDPKSKKMYQPIELRSSNNYQCLVFNDQTIKRFYNQVYSGELNKNRTYKLTFQISDQMPDKPFSIGLGTLAEITNLQYASTPFFKIFQVKEPKDLGCLFVEYGRDLVDLSAAQEQKIVFKFNIGKNMIKFQDIEKQSSNCLAKSEAFSLEKDYCVIVINQNPTIKINLLKAEVKN